MSHVRKWRYSWQSIVWEGHAGANPNSPEPKCKGARRPTWRSHVLGKQVSKFLEEDCRTWGGGICEGSEPLQDDPKRGIGFAFLFLVVFFATPLGFQVFRM